MPILQVRQALTVTLNKSGDLQYRIGDLGAAEGFYTRALGIRRDSLAISAADDKPRLQLDVALSLAKVADIQQVRLQSSLSSATKGGICDA